MNTQITPYNKLRDIVRSDDVQDRFREVLGDRAPVYLASLLSLAYDNDKIAACKPMSVLVSVMKAAILDLPIEPQLGMAWIIPYKNVATFQPGYRGIVQLALRTGLYEDINAGPIYKGEEIKVSRLTGRIEINGEPEGTTPEDEIGYFSYFRLKNGYEHHLYMTREQVIEHAERYSKSWGYKDSPWTTHFSAMATKTILKRNLSKFGVLSIQMRQALAEDNGEEEEIKVTALEDLRPLLEEESEQPDNDKPRDYSGDRLEPYDIADMELIVEEPGVPQSKLFE